MVSIDTFFCHISMACHLPDPDVNHMPHGGRCKVKVSAYIAMSGS